MIYTNQTVKGGTHGLFESSRIKSTDIGHLYDALVKDSEGNAIDVDNGVAIKIGAFTGNGLQEVEATIAAVGDKIAVVGAPALVKDAFTKAQAQANNFYIPAGQDAKAYQLVEEDIFAVASYQFTDGSVANVAKDAYVVVDGNGKWVAQTSEPSADTYGFIGKIHSVAVGTFYTMVRIEVIKNEQVA